MLSICSFFAVLSPFAKVYPLYEWFPKTEGGSYCQYAGAWAFTEPQMCAQPNGSIGMACVYTYLTWASTCRVCYDSCNAEVPRHHNSTANSHRKEVQVDGWVNKGWDVDLGGLSSLPVSYLHQFQGMKQVYMHWTNLMLHFHKVGRQIFIKEWSQAMQLRPRYPDF